jgi:DNA polymerase-3 subunit delta
MAAPAPTVYLLHGDDDLAAAEFVRHLRERLGDAATADLNFQRFEAGTVDLAMLEQACTSIPFLAPRRVVVLQRPSRMAGDGERKGRFLQLLDSLPSTTALVLVEPGDVTKGSPLFAWAESHPDAAYIRRFEAPHGEAFIRWEQNRCQALGGKIEAAAAQLLAEGSGEDPRLVEQELAKLLDYVNRSRAITAQDVETLTALHGQSSVFAMVDAIGQRDIRQALLRLRRLLEDEDPRYAFAMIIRQMRLLIRAREAMETGGNPRQAVGAPPFVADKIAAQARNFSLPALERIYHELLELDLATKSGQADLGIGLDLLIGSLAR